MILERERGSFYIIGRVGVADFYYLRERESALFVLLYCMVLSFYGDFIEECGGVFFGEDGSIDDFDGVVLFGGGAMCA